MKTIKVTSPCQSDPELWFSENKEDIQRSIDICGTCPLKGTCLITAIENKEVHGVWGGKDFNVKGYVSYNKTQGFCRQGKHRLAVWGPCVDCKAESQKRYNQKRKATDRKYEKNRNRPYQRYVMGGTCAKGHDLTPQTTKIREYDKAITCIPCNANRVKPVVVPKGLRMR